MSVSVEKRSLSSIRVKKFFSSTEFLFAKHEIGNFEPPFTLQEGIGRTLDSESISPGLNREIFCIE